METPQRIEECSPSGRIRTRRAIGTVHASNPGRIVSTACADLQALEELNAPRKGELFMNAIEIVYDAKQGQIIMKVQPGLQSKEHDGTIGLNYDEAVQLFSTLGELIEKYEDNEDQLGSSEHRKAVRRG
jgi:hypothetical protein